MHFSKKIVAILLLINFFSLYNSAPESQLAANFSLSSTDSYYYEQKDQTSRIILENSQKGPLQGIIYKDRLFVWLPEPTKGKIVYYENQGVEVINKFFTGVEGNCTLMACFINENVLPAQKDDSKIINTVNKTNYGLFSYKCSLYSDNPEGHWFFLYTNYVGKETSNKIQLNASSIACQLDKHTNPVKSQIYPCKPNDPSADAIACIFSKKNTNIDKKIEYDRCDIGYYDVMKKEFTHRKSLNQAYFQDILYLDRDYQINNLFASLYQNQRPSTNTLDVLILNSGSNNASVTISIDDCKCKWNNNELLFSVLIRVFVSRRIPLFPLYILLEHQEVNKPFNFNKPWKQSYIQIPEGNAFYSGPLYFRDIDKKQSYTILPISFNENIKQPPCNLDIKLVDQKDYFKQPPQVNKKHEEEILKSMTIHTQDKQKDISLMHTILSGETKKLFDNIRETLKKKDADCVESVKTALLPIIEQLEKLCETFDTEAEMLKGIHNRFEVDQELRHNITQKEIGEIISVAEKSKGIIKKAFFDVNNQLNTLKNEFKKQEEELGDLKTDTQKSFTKDFKEITLKFINDFQEMINKQTSTFTSQTKDLLQGLQNEYTDMKANFKQPLEKIKQDGNDTVGKVIVLQKKFEEAYSKWVENIETIFNFVNELEQFKTEMLSEIDKKLSLTEKAQIVINHQLQQEMINVKKEVQELQEKDTQKQEMINEQAKIIKKQQEDIQKSQGFNWRLNFCFLVALLVCSKMMYDFTHNGQWLVIYKFL